MKIRNLLLCLAAVFCVTSCSKKEDGPEFEGPHIISEGNEHDSLNHVDSPYYKFFDVYNAEPTETLKIIPHFETYQQKLSYSCGACAGYMVLNYYDKELASQYDENKVAEIMGSTGGGVGTAASQIVTFFTDLGFEVDYWCDHNKNFALVDDFIYFVNKNLKNNRPIMVDWALGGGHWTTIIGYDNMGTIEPQDDVLIMADSSDAYDHYYDGYTMWPLSRFFSMWRETTPWDGEQIYLQQYVVVYPKTK